MPSTHKTKRSAKMWKWRLPSTRRGKLSLVIVLTLLGLGVTFAGYAWNYQNRLLPRLKIGEIAVGGLEPAEAQERLEQALTKLKEWEVEVKGRGTAKVPLGSLADFDVEGMVATAQRYSQGQSRTQWLVRRLKALVADQYSPVLVTVSEQRLRDGLSESLYSAYDVRAKETTLSIRRGKVAAVPGEAGEQVQRAAVEKAATAAFYSLESPKLVVEMIPFEPEFTAEEATVAVHQAERIIASPLNLEWSGGTRSIETARLSQWITIAGVSRGESRYEAASGLGGSTSDRLPVAEIDTNKVASWLGEIAAEVDLSPRNATVAFESGALRLVSAAQAGRSLAKPETAAAIRVALLTRADGGQSDVVQAITTEIAPAITEKNLQGLGIKELIGRAASDYDGSPNNRRHNISLGAQKISGWIIQPGEEFSAVQAIGPIDGVHGFLPEKVIIGNRLELQYGGGLCQPITTLFQAVLDAGLPVTERTNHGRRVSYYERPSGVTGVRINWNADYANIGSGLVGYDATIYEPRPDLKFKNDTGQAVLIQAHVTDNKRVTFELYGTNDGRQVKVSKAEVLYTRAPTAPIYEDDPSLPAGTEKIVDRAVPGAKTSFTYRVNYSDGREVTQTFTSVYKPVSARYLRGTGPVPAPVAETPTASEVPAVQP